MAGSPVRTGQIIQEKGKMLLEGSRRIAIVTDSSAYLPAGWAEKYNIHIVPLILMMGGKVWRDGVDIHPPAFYELLRSCSDFPTTSQPNVATFEELFKKLSGSVEGIVAVLVSGKLSGTFASAKAAAVNLRNIPIEVIDSQGTSMMMGYALRAAAMVANAGGDLQAVAEAAREKLEKTKMFFVLGTLEFLHRGGRIGSVAKILGSALDLKPILEFRDGMIKAIAKVRTRRKALEKLYSMIDEQVQGAKTFMSVINVAAQEEAAQVKAQLRARFHPLEILETECSPAIGAHAGPGSVAVIFYTED